MSVPLLNMKSLDVDVKKNVFIASLLVCFFVLLCLFVKVVAWIIFFIFACMAAWSGYEIWFKK